MALFSQDLFEVFDEKSEPVTLSGNKRKRSNPQEGKTPVEEQKRFKADAQEGSSSSDNTAAVEGRQSVIDLTGVDESDTKENTSV